MFVCVCGIWLNLYRPKSTQAHISLGTAPFNSVGSACLEPIAIAYINNISIKITKVQEKGYKTQ